GRPGTRSHQDDADLASRARVALCSVRRPLLVAHEDMTKLVLVEDGVVDRKHRTARIAKDHLDALVLQRLDDHLRAGHLLGHNRNSPSFLANRKIEATKKA